MPVKTSLGSRGCGALNTMVLEMIARHSELRAILNALCRENGEELAGLQAAFFLMEGANWQLAASSRLTADSSALLMGICAENIAESLLTTGKGEFEGFLARMLCSGIGEVLGMFVCFGADPAREEAYESLCHLAELAIEQRNLLAELTWKGDHDDVTGLLTRTCFERLLAARLLRAEKNEDTEDSATALLCIDLDRFHLINGVLGHSFGNRVLKCVAMRFQACLAARAGRRGSPEFDGQPVLARVGGDEFAVLTNEEDAVAIAKQLSAALARPFEIDEHQLVIAASIGIGTARQGGTAELLQREAYIALYHAKRSGKGRWVRFEASLASTPPERLEMERCLRSALAKDELELHYQPQIGLATGAVCGAEALLRWNPEGLGRISPGAFVPILEETGLIVEFGQWVLREACRQGVRWHEATGSWLRIGVNVSTLQFRDPRFGERVARILDETGFPGDFLELELTESIFIGDFERAREVFAELRKTGVRTALDDFGTGQSSLAYLQNLPFQRLKIDQTFISGISGDKCPALVENIIRIAADLGMRSIAEGIERPSQCDVLRAAGCDEGQGYLFGHALPPDEFLALQQSLGVSS